MKFNPFLNEKSIDFSKLKEIADNNLKFDENGGELSIRVEKTVEKRRNCLICAIFPFPTMFSIDLYCRYVKT